MTTTISFAILVPTGRISEADNAAQMESNKLKKEENKMSQN